MKNRFVGIILIVLAVTMGIISFSYNRSLNKIATDSCSDIAAGIQCPIVESFNFQTTLSLVFIGLLLLMGVSLILFSEEENKVTESTTTQEGQKMNDDAYQQVVKELHPEEKEVFQKIIDAQGSIFQSELATQELTKVKITRILDKLEGKGLIERKRRGMTNVVILKR